MPRGRRKACEHEWFPVAMDYQTEFLVSGLEKRAQAGTDGRD